MSDKKDVNVDKLVQIGNLILEVNYRVKIVSILYVIDFVEEDFVIIKDNKVKLFKEEKVDFLVFEKLIDDFDKRKDCNGFFKVIYQNI